MSRLELTDELQSLNAAYMGLSSLASEARSCSSEDVANILYVLNERLSSVTKLSVEYQ